MEEDIQIHSQTVMFRGTPCMQQYVNKIFWFATIYKYLNPLGIH